MKILFQHNGILPVIKYGGIERIIYWHMLELVKLGHQVYLIGNPENQLEKTGIKLIKCYDFENWKNLIPTSIDIIHLFYNSKPIDDIPLIISMECNGQPGEVFHPNTVFVSKNHAANHNSECFVYNGINLEDYPYQPTKKNWNQFCFLAKGSWSVKNLKDTIKACKRTKNHLNIMGGRAILPSRYINSYGMVDNKEKLNILRTSDGLIFPVRWNEPFGIAIIEAMSQGLAVIGSSYGSLPELIQKDTGILCYSFQDLIETLTNNHLQFDCDYIRKYVEENFSINNFTTSYLSMYQDIIDNKSLNQQTLSWKQDYSPQLLLPF